MKRRKREVEEGGENKWNKKERERMEEENRESDENLEDPHPVFHINSTVYDLKHGVYMCLYMCLQTQHACGSMCVHMCVCPHHLSAKVQEGCARTDGLISPSVWYRSSQYGTETCSNNQSLELIPSPSWLESSLGVSTITAESFKST